jgi:hypothetical protein
MQLPCSPGPRLREVDPQSLPNSPACRATYHSRFPHPGRRLSERVSPRSPRHGCVMATAGSRCCCGEKASICKRQARPSALSAGGPTDAAKTAAPTGHGQTAAQANRGPKNQGSSLRRSCGGHRHPRSLAPQIGWNQHLLHGLCLDETFDSSVNHCVYTLVDRKFILEGVRCEKPCGSA